MCSLQTIPFSELAAVTRNSFDLHAHTDAGSTGLIPGNPVRMASNRFILQLLASACSVHLAACVNLIMSTSLAKGTRADAHSPTP